MGGMAKLHTDERELKWQIRNRSWEVVVERNQVKETPEFESLNPGEEFVIRMQTYKIWEKGSG